MSDLINPNAVSAPLTNVHAQQPVQQPAQPGQAGPATANPVVNSNVTQQNSIPLDNAAVASPPPIQATVQAQSTVPSQAQAAGGSLHKPRLLTGISSNVLQHVLLVRDCSGSMSGSKINELNVASVALHEELKVPTNKDAFIVSIVEFNSSAHRSLFGQAATQAQFPQANAGGGTNFDSALLETIRTVKEFAAQPNPKGNGFMRPHVLFLSDGHSNVSDKNIRELHEYADVTAIAYGGDANQDTLVRISTFGKVEIVGTNGGALREFLSQLGHTISQQLQLNQ